jgi:hypothetical protein
MKRTTTKIFDLVPSLQQREESLAPAAFLPAVPVRIEVEDGPATYAIIDTAAKISVANRKLVKVDPNTPISGSTRMKGPGGQETIVHIVKTSLIVCDTDFSPWLRLIDVPIALVPEQEQEGADLVLGFDACLALLHLTIDYPRQQFQVSAPVCMLVIQEGKATAPLPSRIIEAERLLTSGSYEAAVALAMAGVEEVFAEFARDMSAGSNWGHELKHLTTTLLDEQRRQLFRQLSAIRSRAVHGPHTQHVSAAEASMAIRAAQELANWVQSEHGSRRTSNASLELARHTAATPGKHDRV